MADYFINQPILLPKKPAFYSKYHGVTEAMQRGFNTYFAEQHSQSPDPNMPHKHARAVRLQVGTAMRTGFNQHLARILAGVATETRDELDKYIRRLLPAKEAA